MRELDWRMVDQQDRWHWWEELWLAGCELLDRYELPLCSDWFKRPIPCETVAALAVRVSDFDSGTWNDPVAKLTLLVDLEHVRRLLRDGGSPFIPSRHRRDFELHLVEIGCPPPRPAGAAAAPESLRYAPDDTDFIK